MIFDVENWLKVFDTSPLHQFAKFNDFIWLQLVFSKKTFLILYPSLENSTTGIAIVLVYKLGVSFTLRFTIPAWCVYVCLKGSNAWCYFAIY